MPELYWKCPVCSFEAATEEEKIDHLREMINDPEHRMTSTEEEVLEIN